MVIMLPFSLGTVLLNSEVMSPTLNRAEAHVVRSNNT